MIHAEISVYPMGTGTTSASFYIARAVEAIRGIDGLRYEVTPMGTLLEADGLDAVGEAEKRMSQAVHNLGVGRVGIVLKVDSRTDKRATLEGKVDSVRRHLEARGREEGVRTP